jgi:hypothetical protein
MFSYVPKKPSAACFKGWGVHKEYAGFVGHDRVFLILVVTLVRWKLFLACVLTDVILKSAINYVCFGRQQSFVSLR